MNVDLHDYKCFSQSHLPWTERGKDELFKFCVVTFRQIYLIWELYSQHVQVKSKQNLVAILPQILSVVAGFLQSWRGNIEVDWKGFAYWDGTKFYFYFLSTIALVLTFYNLSPKSGKTASRYKPAQQNVLDPQRNERCPHFHRIAVWTWSPTRHAHSFPA